MLEIYNEQVRDLLTKDNPKGGLKVRQNPKQRLFYVEKLKKVAVGSYKEIERRMEEGGTKCLKNTKYKSKNTKTKTLI